MERANVLKAHIISLSLLSWATISCIRLDSYEVNMFTIDDSLIEYDTLGETTDEVLRFIYRLDTLLSSSKSGHEDLTWTINKSFGDSLKSFTIIQSEPKFKFDYQVFYYRNKVLFISIPDGPVYRLVRNSHCNFGICEEESFEKVHSSIDSLRFPNTYYDYIDENMFVVDSLRIEL